MTKEKYALLDTDFISKMHRIQIDEESFLIDRIMELPNYHFYCHNQIRVEIARHNILGSKEWLEKMISKQRIKCYSDSEILEELEMIYGNFATTASVYANFLETACEAFSSGYFSEYFPSIQELNYMTCSKEEFLKKLNNDEQTMGEGKSLGEIKAYVLLQFLNFLFGEQIYFFCSDDKNARKGIISFSKARCISVLSSFIRLSKENVLQKSEAQPYIESYLQFCSKNNQINFRVQENTKQGRMLRIPCRQVLDEIFDGKIKELQNGNLRYCN